MKLYILSAFCGTLLSFSASAQDIIKPVEPKPSKWAIGIQGQLAQSLGNSEVEYLGNYKTYGAAFFSRYYLGEHFAIETGISGTLSHKIIDAGAYYRFDDIGVTLQTSSFEIPLLLQYHLGKRTAVLRPYFSGGVGYVRRKYDVRQWQKGQPGTERDYSFDGNTPSVQFAQGITYQLNRNVQFNQGFFWQYEMRNNRNNIGFRFGLGYTL